MALFDEDNPGKNLANATLWLEASADAGYGAESPGGNGGCVTMTLVMIGLCLLGATPLTCASHVLFG